MTSKKLDTIRAYWEGSANADWAAAGRCIGPGYEWVDHATGVVARSDDELQESLADEMPWSNVRFEITNVFDAADGVVIVQAIKTGTIMGTWRSMDATGQQVSLELCTIFRFNADERIVFEEAYYDMSTVMRQLGYLPAS